MAGFGRMDRLMADLFAGKHAWPPEETVTGPGATDFGPLRRRSRSQVNSPSAGQWPGNTPQLLMPCRDGLQRDFFRNGGRRPGAGHPSSQNPAAAPCGDRIEHRGNSCGRPRLKATGHCRR